MFCCLWETYLDKSIGKQIDIPNIGVELISLFFLFFFLKQIYVAKQNYTSSSSKLTNRIKSNVFVSPGGYFMREISGLVF